MIVDSYFTNRREFYSKIKIVKKNTRNKTKPSQKSQKKAVFREIKSSRAKRVQKYILFSPESIIITFEEFILYKENIHREDSD
jgi:hypothetical protein